MATQQPLPRVALIADSDLHRHVLQNMLLEAGYQLAPMLSPEQICNRRELAHWVEPDAWLVDLASDVQDTIELIVETSEASLLAVDHMPPTSELQAFEQWQRRLLKKLELVAVAKHPEHEESELQLVGKPSRFEKVWVLAASMGGPDAVKRFLDALDMHLPIAMVYAQHIEKAFDKQLTNTVGRNQHYRLRLAQGEHQLLAGEVTVVPVDRQLRFLEHGRIVATREPWQGFYQPAIDQVIAELARQYRDRLGVIVFSGMCEDGAIGCRVAKACGATVWAQSPESCVSANMPEAAIQTGCVSKQGTPEQLAQALTEQMKKTH
jgi:chemosensory pili system protein ChpB (putative protein-glutamate methylesterase)